MAGFPHKRGIGKEIPHPLWIYVDHREMLKDANIDALSITAPDHLTVSGIVIDSLATLQEKEKRECLAQEPSH